MRVDSIQSCYSINKFFFNTDKRNITFSSGSDTFVKADFDFNREVNNTYSKLQKAMGIVTKNEVIKKASKISASTGVKIDDVYSTLATISEYANFNSFERIEEGLKQNGIAKIVRVPDEFTDGKLPLSNVMEYVCMKTLNKFEGDDAIMLDSVLFENLKNMDAEKKERFFKFLDDTNTKLVYFESFENGYNFLNQSKNFDEFTVDVLQKAKERQNKNGKSIYYNVKTILNADFFENLPILFPRNVNIIRDESFPNIEKITENLNPIMPSKNEFQNVISKVTSKASNPIGAKKDVIKFLNENMRVVTPRLYGEYLKDMHKQLQKFLAKQGKTMDDVYFIMPSYKKSFVYANYSYAKANNIENPKYVFLPYNHNDKFDTVKALPEGSVALIVDDCILTGMSMQNDYFPYTNLAESLPKDTNVVFAAVVSSKNGTEILDLIAKFFHRNDKVISAVKLPSSYMNSDYLNLMYDFETDNSMTTSLIFPYMGPDLNCEQLISLYEKFLYNKNAQKLTMGVAPINYLPIQK